VYHDLPLRDATSTDVVAFCGYLGSVNDERNQLVHAIWLTLDDGAVHRAFRKATPKRGLHAKSEAVTAMTILALADKCDEADRKLYQYILAAEPKAPHTPMS
jgi:hypothetical protein